MSKKRKDKRYTVRQVIKEMQYAYDYFETVSEQALREEFGFGDVRLQRFKDRFAELASEELMRIESGMRRRLRR